MNTATVFSRDTQEQEGTGLPGRRYRELHEWPRAGIPVFWPLLQGQAHRGATMWG